MNAIPTVLSVVVVRETAATSTVWFGDYSLNIQDSLEPGTLSLSLRLAWSGLTLWLKLKLFYLTLRTLWTSLFLETSNMTRTPSSQCNIDNLIWLIRFTPLQRIIFDKNIWIKCQRMILYYSTCIIIINNAAILIPPYLLIVALYNRSYTQSRM